MKRPTFTVRLKPSKLIFMLTIVFHEDWIPQKQRGRNLCFRKFSLKHSKFRFLSKSRHLPFVLKSLETRIKTMKIFLTGNLKWKRPTFTVRLNFALRVPQNMEWISRKVSRHLPFVYSFLGNFAPHKKIFLLKWKNWRKRGRHLPFT